MTEALEVEVTAPVVSFRNPLYAGVQVGLPCPPPPTIAGMLASTVGGWDRVPEDTAFGAAFVAGGEGRDLETYHPLDAKGRHTDPTPKDRDFLADVRLTLWFIDHLDLWMSALRRPVWPLRLGRSQDLASARTRAVQLNVGPGRQGEALIPHALTRAGTLLRLPTAVSADRARTRWDSYRYAAGHADVEIPSDHVTEDGQAVALISDVHPAQFNRQPIP